MKKYPLVFSFRDMIAGKGFVAGVTMDGKVLLSQEDDGGWWMYGVQPGGIAGGGDSREVAFREFKNRYLSVLFDIASVASDFEAFEHEAKDFFRQVSDPTSKDWDAARKEVRRGKLAIEGLDKVNASKKHPAVHVVRLGNRRTTPAENKFDVFAPAA